MGKLLRLLGLLLPLIVSKAALAQSCTITTTNLASGSPYAPQSGLTVDTSGIFSISCTRPNGSTKFPSSFWVGVNTGSNYSGSSRRLRFGASNYLNYALYQNAGCTAPWADTVSADGYLLGNSATTGSATTTTPNPLTSGTTFCFRIPAGQTAAPSGIYTDTVTISVRSTDQTGFLWGQASFQLSTSVGAYCSLTAPTNITLNYTSFSASAVTGQSTFSTTCTSTTPYTMSLDATSGTLLGLNYTLALSATSGTGSGSAQNYTIDATIPAGQSGICAAASCNASAIRALTLSY